MNRIPTFVTIVSGLPRSGTSLMMQMLAAGGMPVLTDGIRARDEDNPRGYLEFEPVKKTRDDASWLETAQGKAVKMVYVLLRALPENLDYRVIMMHRNLREVIESQRRMLERSGRKGADVSAERMEKIFVDQLRMLRKWLDPQPNFRVLDVEHRDCLLDPSGVAARVDEFLGMNLDRAQMAGVIDPALYRNRA